jgi:alkylation response protein AidB-like acyl-CoA dehydrogenase
MDFSFTQEQEDLRREARAFLEANPSPSMDQLRELGWVGILQSEDFSFLDAAVLFEELGRVLYQGPFTLNEVAAQPGGEVWSIEVDGFVPHLAQVQRVLTPDMRGGVAEGETLATVDETLGLGRLTPNGAEPAEGTWDEVRRRLLAALALEAVGIGSKATEMAIAYVSEREQFGKKIGTYQAISHSVVDAYVAVELSRSLAYWAAWCVAEGDEQAELACAAAKSQAAEAAVLACEKSIQAHGGIGFTWEHPLHRYYKRALWLEGALGYGRDHRAEIAESLLSS